MTGSKDTLSGQESESLLNAAVEEVITLHQGDVVRRNFSSDVAMESQDDRDSTWSQTVQRYPHFSDKILALRESLKVADQVREDESVATIIAQSLNFCFVPNPFTQVLLTDILLARVGRRQGRFLFPQQSNAQVIEMAQELTLQGDFSDRDIAAGIRSERVIGAILTGKLGITQAPSRELA